MADHLVDRVPKSPFEKILNFRDVGATVNVLSGRRLLKTGKLFRSAQLDFASPADRDALVSDYAIRTVIDLRSKTEHSAAAKALFPGSDTSSASRAASRSLIPESTQTTTSRLAFPEFSTLSISLTGPAFERALVWRLSWIGLVKLIYALLFTTRLAALTLLATEVLQPRGLLGLARDTLLASTREIRSIFAALADPAAYPLAVHCTQGKDRTGIVAALLLLLLLLPQPTQENNKNNNDDNDDDDVNVEAVIGADYAASGRELAPEREARVAQMRAVGLGEEFADCAEGFVGSLRGFLEDGWGGVEGYLGSVGVGAEMREAVRRCLLADDEEEEEEEEEEGVE